MKTPDKKNHTRKTTSNKSKVGKYKKRMKIHRTKGDFFLLSNSREKKQQRKEEDNERSKYEIVNMRK